MSLANRARVLGRIRAHPHGAPGAARTGIKIEPAVGVKPRLAGGTGGPVGHAFPGIGRPEAVANGQDVGGLRPLDLLPLPPGQGGGLEACGARGPGERGGRSGGEGDGIEGRVAQQPQLAGAPLRGPFDGDPIDGRRVGQSNSISSLVTEAGANRTTNSGPDTFRDCWTGSTLRGASKVLWARKSAWLSTVAFTDLADAPRRRMVRSACTSW